MMSHRQVCLKRYEDSGRPPDQAINIVIHMKMHPHMYMDMHSIILEGNAILCMNTTNSSIKTDNRA